MPTVESRPWRILAGACQITQRLRRERRPATAREQAVLGVASRTLRTLDAERVSGVLGDYGLYRLSEFQKRLVS